MVTLQKNDAPLVTVGIPVYNDERYVEAAIEDILAQTYRNLEIVISDNFSTDDSTEICWRYVSKDARVRYVRQERNLGPHANFRYLIDQAQGRYFMWAASDDRWDPEFIERLVYTLEEEPEAAVAFCPYVEIDEQGGLLPGMHSFDFGGASALTRITKFHLEPSGRRDAFFYGLFRMSTVVKMNFVKWWWINKTIPMNNAYPPLSYILAAGNYRLVPSNKPLWFNRVHSKSAPRHSADLASRPLFAYVAFHLRKFNQLYETEKAVLNGSGSYFICLLVFPVLFARCLWDCVLEAKRIAMGATRRLQSSIHGLLFK
jgi:glycosyltransferase involved in cell wall biosynthesis